MLTENENDIASNKKDITLLKNVRETNIVEMANLFKSQGDNSIFDEKMLKLMKETEASKVNSEELKKKNFDNEKQVNKNTARYAKNEETNLTRKIREISFSILNQILPSFSEEFLLSLKIENGIDISYTVEHLKKLRRFKKLITKWERTKNYKFLSIINLISTQIFLQKLENYEKNSENINLNDDDEKNKMEIESKSSSNNNEVFASCNANPSFREERFSISNDVQMKSLNLPTFTQENLNDMKKHLNFNRDLDIKKSQSNLKRKFEITLERSCQKKLQKNKSKERVCLLSNWNKTFDNLNCVSKTNETVQNSKESNTLNLKEMKGNFQKEKNNLGENSNFIINEEMLEKKNTMEVIGNTKKNDKNCFKPSGFLESNNFVIPEIKGMLQEKKNSIEEESNIIINNEEKHNQAHTIEFIENKDNTDKIISNDNDIDPLISISNNMEQIKEKSDSNLNTNLIQCEKNQMESNFVLNSDSKIKEPTVTQTSNPPANFKDSSIIQALNPSTSSVSKENADNNKFLEEGSSSSYQPKENFLNKNIVGGTFTDEVPNQSNISNLFNSDHFEKVLTNTVQTQGNPQTSTKIAIDLKEPKEAQPVNQEILIHETKNLPLKNSNKLDLLNDDTGTREIFQSDSRDKDLAEKTIKVCHSSNMPVILKNEPNSQFKESNQKSKVISFPQQQKFVIQKKNAIKNNDCIVIESSEESSDEEVMEIKKTLPLNSKENLSTQKARASSTNKSISDVSKDSRMQTNKNLFSTKKKELAIDYKLSNNKKSEQKYNNSSTQEKEKSTKGTPLNNTFQFLKTNHSNNNKASTELLENKNFPSNLEDNILLNNEINHSGISDISKDLNDEEKKETQPKVKFVSKKEKESSSDFLNSAAGITEFLLKKNRKYSGDEQEDYKFKRTMLKFDRKFEKHHGAFIEYSLQTDKIK